MNRKFHIIWITLAVVIFGIAGITMAQGVIDTSHGNEEASGNDDVKTGYIAFSESLPDSPEVKTIEATVIQGWKLRHEAGLEKNKGKEDTFRQELQRYFSNQPKLAQRNEADHIDSMMSGEVNLPPEKIRRGVSPVRPSPLQQLDDTASELERQLAYIDNGRYFEEMANFAVLDFKIDKVEFKRIRLEGNTAAVVVDIFFRSKYLHTNPDGTQIISQPVGGEQHTFKLVRSADGWKVSNDTFIMIPGYEP